MRALRFQKSEEGGVMVEAALLLPVLLLLGLGAFELSHLFMQHQAVTAGVRDAARYAARAPRPLGVSCEDAVNSAELVTAARNLALSGDISSPTPARVTGWKPEHITVTATTYDNPIDPLTGSRLYRGPDPMCVVRVTSAYSFSKLNLFAAFNFVPKSISVSHTERWIGG